jgi:predicted aspartyl protease
MGYVWVDAVIGNPFTGRKIVVKVLVDTEAMYTVIPRRIFEELQLPPRGRRGEHS